MKFFVKSFHLLKRLKSPQGAVANVGRHFSDAPEFLPPLSDVSLQVLSLLQTSDSVDWPANKDLPTLLSSLTPASFLIITRQLKGYQNAINFFNHLTTIPLESDCLSLAFQAVIEHAIHENPNRPAKLLELFELTKERNVPLSVKAAALLIKFFGRGGLLEKSVLVFDSIDPDSRNTHVFNLVIDVYFRCRCENAALKMLDEMLKPDSNFPPNKHTVSMVFSYILKKNWNESSIGYDKVCELVLKFCEQGISPDAFLLSQIITKLCRNDQSDKAWDILHKVIDMGFDVGSASCNALLTGLGKDHDYSKMTLFMKEMKEKGIKPDIVTTGIMINHLCKIQKVGEAMQIFEKMRNGDLGIKPDLIIFNTMISGLCKVGRQQEGLQLMETMCLEGNCKPNASTYNCLIDGFCKYGELESGLELFDQMVKAGTEPNVITLNTLVDGMCRHGRVSSAMEFFRDMGKKGLKGNQITYTTLIVAFCNANNIDKAMMLFDEMQGNGCTPDAMAFYALISGLSQSGRMDDASMVVSKMKRAGFGLDALCCNVLLSGFCRKKKLDKVFEMLKDMEQAGIKPDRVTYNILISFSCAEGDLRQAHRLMREMIDDGLTPTVVTFGALIQGFCSNNDLVEAMRIFRDMNSSSKVPPNTVIYNMLINAHVKAEKVEAALSLMDDMKDKKVNPNTTTYNAMFKGLQQRNWIEKAMLLMDQMTKEACKPDYITMEILTEWFSIIGKTKMLKDFVGRL